MGTEPFSMKMCSLLVLEAGDWLSPGHVSNSLGKEESWLDVSDMLRKRWQTTTRKPEASGQTTIVITEMMLIFGLVYGIKCYAQGWEGEA